MPSAPQPPAQSSHHPARSQSETPRSHQAPPFPAPQPCWALLSPEQSSGPALTPSPGPNPPRPGHGPLRRSSPGLGRASLLVPPCLQSASCPVAFLAASPAPPASSVMCCVHSLTAVWPSSEPPTRIQALPSGQPPAPPPRPQTPGQRSGSQREPRGAHGLSPQPSNEGCPAGAQPPSALQVQHR